MLSLSATYLSSSFPFNFIFFLSFLLKVDIRSVWALLFDSKLVWLFWLNKFGKLHSRNFRPSGESKVSYQLSTIYWTFSIMNLSYFANPIPWDLLFFLKYNAYAGEEKSVCVFLCLCWPNKTDGYVVFKQFSRIKFKRIQSFLWECVFWPSRHVKISILIDSSPCFLTQLWVFILE